MHSWYKSLMCTESCLRVTDLAMQMLGDILKWFRLEASGHSVTACLFLLFLSLLYWWEKHWSTPIANIATVHKHFVLHRWGWDIFTCDVSNSLVGCSERSEIQTDLTCFPQYAVIWLHSYHACLSTYILTVFLFQSRQCPDSGLILLSCEHMKIMFIWWLRWIQVDVVYLV